MTVIPVHIPEAAYDAIMLAVEPPLTPTVGSLNVQHCLVWPDLQHPGIALALIRGEDAP